jgi:hypothetical protein
MATTLNGVFEGGLMSLHTASDPTFVALNTCPGCRGEVSLKLPTAA